MEIENKIEKHTQNPWVSHLGSMLAQFYASTYMCVELFHTHKWLLWRVDLNLQNLIRDAILNAQILNGMDMELLNIHSKIFLGDWYTLIGRNLQSMTSVCVRGHCGHCL